MNHVILGSILVSLCGIARSTDLFFRTHVIERLPILQVIFWEHLIISISLIPLVFYSLKDYLKINVRDFILLLLVGCGTSAMGILCFTQAFRYMNPALAVMFQKLQPLITICLGIVVLREKPVKNFFPWAFLAIVASYFAAFSDINPFSGNWKRIACGAGFAFASAFFWGSGTVWGKLLLRKFDKRFILINRFFLGTAFLASAVGITDTEFGTALVFGSEDPIIFNILYMALIPGLAATTLFYYGLEKVQASITSILELVFPISSVAIMWIYFNKPLDKIQIAACIILFAAIIAITNSGKKIECEPQNMTKKEVQS